MSIIVKTGLEFIREPLIASLGFKGSYLDELWQVICQIKDDNGYSGTGLGVQSILWSDSSVFTDLSQCGGNTAMLMTTQYALTLIQNRLFLNPPDMVRTIFPDVYAFAQQVTRTPNLKETFVLNALVCLDFAMWQLYAAENGITSFEQMTHDFTNSFTHRHAALGIIPLVTYSMETTQILILAQHGFFFFKIKLGQDPGQRHDQEEMLEADMHRILEIHTALNEFTTPYTDSGHLLYYFDANGRYESMELLVRLLDYMAAIGALQRTVLFEEPFPEDLQIPVNDLPVRIAGDESAHSPEDVRRLIDDLGYGAIALKPIAKTLCVTLQMLDEAFQRGIPCFCADLTVNPLMTDWNKCVACRIAPLPGIKIGVMECNGEQNYQNWQLMKDCHPIPDASWQKTDGGLFHLDESFYQMDGGILLPPRCYQSFLNPF